MELLLIRIDQVRDRKQYVGILRQWLKEIGIDNGRLIAMGNLSLLFIAADTTALNDALLASYRSKSIDSNSRNELCVDRFIDVLGRKKVDSCACKGFLEMNILNESMLRKLLVEDWFAESSWIDIALATPRSKAFLEWREAAKAARSERRKRSAKERIEQREAKRLRLEQEKEKEEEEEEKKKEKKENAGADETGGGRMSNREASAEADGAEVSTNTVDTKVVSAAAGQSPIRQSNQIHTEGKEQKRKKTKRKKSKHKN